MRPIVELLSQLRDDEFLTVRRDRRERRDDGARQRERAPTEPNPIVVDDDFGDEGPTEVRRAHRRETEDERTRVFRVIK